MLSQQTVHIRYRGPEIGPGLPQPPRLVLPVPRYKSSQVKDSIAYTVQITYAIVSADGPSRAGPISDRVVKPDALDDYC